MSPLRSGRPVRKLNDRTNPYKVPTYEFTCPDGHDFDKFFRSMASAPTVVPCPVCGKPADRKVSGGAGLVFHGSGFYITDYGKDGKKDQKPPRRTSDSAKDSGGESSSGDSGGSAGASTEAKSSDASSSSSAGAGASESKASDSPAKTSESAPKPSPAPKAAE